MTKNFPEWSPRLCAAFKLAGLVGLGLLTLMLSVHLMLDVRNGSVPVAAMIALALLRFRPQSPLSHRFWLQFTMVGAVLAPAMVGGIHLVAHSPTPFAGNLAALIVGGAAAVFSAGMLTMPVEVYRAVRDGGNIYKDTMDIIKCFVGIPAVFMFLIYVPYAPVFLAASASVAIATGMTTEHEMRLRPMLVFELLAFPLWTTVQLVAIRSFNGSSPLTSNFGDGILVMVSAAVLTFLASHSVWLGARTYRRLLESCMPSAGGDATLNS